MRTSNHPLLRVTLQAHPDGLDTTEITQRTGLKNNVINAALKAMPDTYIDRWVEGGHRMPPRPIWCIVTPPEDCPRPNPKGTPNAANRN